jgi:hypothetical protein
MGGEKSGSKKLGQSYATLKFVLQDVGLCGCGLNLVAQCSRSMKPPSIVGTWAVCPGSIAQAKGLCKYMVSRFCPTQVCSGYEEQARQAEASIRQAKTT